MAIDQFFYMFMVNRVELSCGAIKHIFGSIIIGLNYTQIPVYWLIRLNLTNLNLSYKLVISDAI